MTSLLSLHPIALTMAKTPVLANLCAIVNHSILDMEDLDQNAKEQAGFVILCIGDAGHFFHFVGNVLLLNSLLVSGFV